MYSDHVYGGQPSLQEPEFDGEDRPMFGIPVTSVAVEREDRPLRPINWNLLTSGEAEAEWHDLDAWAKWLRTAFGLPPTIVAPFWYRHDELVWELSALHLHWLSCHDPEGSPSGPIAWHREFPDAKNRLRELVATCGTRLDRDRPTRQTVWPGEAPADPRPEVVIKDRDADFRQFVAEDVAARRRIEERVHSSVR